MDADIAKGPLGSVGSYDVSFTGGVLVCAADAADGPVSAKLNFNVDGAKLRDALKAADGGSTLLNACIDVVFSALGVK